MGGDSREGIVTVKKIYELPRLRSHGDIRDVTRGESTGSYFDVDFATFFESGGDVGNIFS